MNPTTANINPETGVAYGYVSANVLDPGIVCELMDSGTDLSYQDAAQEYAMYQGFSGGSFSEAEQWLEQRCLEFQYEQYEPHIEGEAEGVKYSTSWLGGALNFFIFKSPFMTGAARRASPCVPNCGILDVLDGEVTSYNVPPDWRAESG